jgi:hypothetical protein
LTANVYCWQSVPVERTASNEKVRVVPGVEGPRWITDDRGTTSSRQGGAVGLRLRVEYDDDLRRYVCTEFTARRTADTQEGRGYVTSETLREPAVGMWIAVMLNTDDVHGHRVIRELPNENGAEPWGWTPPEGLSKEGPSDRALRWVAHLYHYGMAVSLNPAKIVEDFLGLSHSTAARWVRLARQKGYLGPSEGPGRAAG